jgi:hypothetical protein
MSEQLPAKCESWSLQGDLPMGANMLRTDSAPSPDGPPNTGYTRPAKVRQQMPNDAALRKALSMPA